VTAKQIAEKRYVVKLSDEERERLNTLIRAGKHPAPHDSPHKYTASLHEAQSSGEQRLLVEQSGKHQHQRM
jgi:hypothetical protein